MVSWGSYLPGLGGGDEDEEDAVTRTLRLLGQGAEAATQTAREAGTAVGTGIRAAGETVGSYLPDLTPEAAPPQYSGPSYAQPSRAPGQPSMLEQLPAVGAAYVRGAESAFDERVPLLTGMRPPETPEEIIPAASPAPVRGVQVISDVGSRAGGEAGGEFAERAMGTEPIFTTNELQTPLGTIPSVSGPTPRQVGTVVGSVLGDPTTYLGFGVAGRAADLPVGAAIRATPGALRAAGQGIGTAAQGARRVVGEAVQGVSGALDANAARVAAADARMAAQGSTAAPGVFGLSGIEPDLPAVRGMRPRVVPPEVADELDFPIRPPTDPATIRAIEAAGGTVDERGVTLNVIRMQDPEAAGGVATRGMPFYTAGPPGAPSPYARQGRVGPTEVGGQQRIEGPTRFRNPLIISDAPGDARGFNDAVNQLGRRDTAEITALQDELARLDRVQEDIVLRMRQAEMDRAPTEALQRQYDEVSNAAADVWGRLNGLQQGLPTADAVMLGVQRARHAGPEGSPERAAALKELVSRYGGDPEVIDDLLAIRGADASESAWAIKENIVAANARRAGHDGVITMAQQPVPSHEVSQHPMVIEAKALREAAAEARAVAEDAHRAAPTAANWRAFQRAEESYYAAQDALEAARNDAAAALSRREITELADPRELRNPTPGAPTGEAAQLQDAIRAAQARMDELKPLMLRGEGDQAALRDEWQRVQTDFYNAGGRLRELEQAGGTTGPPGYTLRPDLPRRPAPTYDELVERWNRLAAENRAAIDAGDRATSARLSARLDEVMAALKRAEPTTAQASAGALPAARGSDPLAGVNRVLSQGLVSSVSGGMSAAAADELGDPNDPYRQAKAFAAGALIPPLGQRGARALARAAGAAPSPGGGALATLGAPGAGGFQPPPGLLARFPGVQKALAASQQRAANMQARGITPPTAWEWAKQAGFSGIFGPATASGQVIGGALEVGMAQPKEALRALTSRGGGRYGAQLAAQARALPESLSGFLDVVLGRGGAAGAAARSGGSQGTAKLSERTVHPLAHAAARVLERSGEIWAESPDAIFRPIFTAQGMRREADLIAHEAGLTGRQAKAHADQVMQDAQAARANPNQPLVSADARRVVDAGQAYADELGYKGDPGKAADWLAKQAQRNDFVGLAASYAIPFPGMAGRTTRAALRMTPGVGLLPGVRAGRPLAGFDTIHDQALGAVALASMGAYAANGGITGSGPSDPEERKALIATGWQPNSMRVGDWYVPNRLFQKFGPILNAVGEAHDTVAYGKPGRKTGEWVDDAAKRLGTVVTDQTGLSGLSDIYDLIFGQAGFSAQAPGTLARGITRYTPFGGTIRAAAQATDPEGVARKPETWAQTESFPEAVGQQLAQNIPANPLTPDRGDVPVAQDILGRPLPNPQQGFGALIPKTTTARDDPTLSAFEEAGVQISSPPGTVSYTPRGGRAKGVETAPVEMTPEEQRRWNTLRGEAIIDEVARAQRSAFWQRADREARQDELRAIVAAANKAASEQIIDEMGRDYDRRLDAAIERERAGRGLAPVGR